MVATDEHQKYLVLDGVRVSYRKKDNTIHLTSTDADVQAGGFHLSLSHGTQTENTLRELLQEHGLIKPEASKAKTAVDPGLTWKKRAHRGRIISVTSAKGGVGKSTLALMLASVLHHKQDVGDGYQRRAPRVCVVDLDLFGPTLGLILGQTAPTAASIALTLVGEASKRAEKLPLDRYLVEDPQLGISALLGSTRGSTQRFVGESTAAKPALLSPRFYAEVIQQLADDFDIVLVDTDVACFEPMTQMAYDISDGIVYVTAPNTPALYGLSRWTQEVTKPRAGHVKLDPTSIGVVVNKAEADLGVDMSLVQQAAGDSKILGAVPWSKAVIRGTNMGKLPATISEHENVRLSLARISDHLIPRSPRA